MKTLGKASRLEQLNWCIQCFIKEPDIKKNREDEKAEKLDANRLEDEANIVHKKKAKVEAKDKSGQKVC